MIKRTFNRSQSFEEAISKFNTSNPTKSIKPKRAKPRKLESSLQRTCVEWFRLRYPQLSKLLFAVPNGGSRNVIEATNLKREGVTSGVADLILLHPSSGGTYHSLCIEMKHGKGKQQESQMEWEQAAVSAGNKYIVCNSLERFIAEVSAHLEGVKR